MTLGELFNTVTGAFGDCRPKMIAAEAALTRTVKGLAYDSRRVTPGSVFVAIRGQRADGITFVPQAASRGALGVVAEVEPPAGQTLPWLVVPDARAALAVMAAAFYNHPSRDMQVVGITGTNGKTTTAYLTAALFEQADVRCGLMGTVVYRIGDEAREAGRTTPEAPDVQQLLREMITGGCGACVMEVSSHALELRRVDGVRFAAAVFTNLTRDHLDFHGDMESYFRSKRRLFDMLPPDGVAVVNIDDARGATLAAGPWRHVTYGIDRPADVRPIRLELSLGGLRFDAITPAGPVHVDSRLVGRPNLYNLLAALATGVALGLPVDAIERGLAAVTAVPGRFELVSEPFDDLTVIVDYAHTDDALRNLLETARPMATRRLITVFGCGGDRDRSKRPLMGAVAARLSDVVIVTSDNPRSEDPAAIIEEIKLGIVPPAERHRTVDRAPNGQRPPVRMPQVVTLVDRRAAIERAVAMAEAGDMVVIAGKGHEKHQVIGDRKIPFDDVEVARAALARRRSTVTQP